MKEVGFGKTAEKAMLKILTVIAILFLTLFVSGCVDTSSITDKLATGQTLTAEETKIYEKNKDDFDKLVATQKQEAEEKHYKEATDAEISAGKRLYKRYKENTQSEFDITTEACKKIGFLAGTRIELPSGKKANIVGVFDNHIWFHVEGNKGATFSGNSNLAEFTKEGYKIIEEAPHVPPDTYVKTIEKSQQAISAETSKTETVNAQPKVQDSSEGNSYYKTIPRVPYTEKN
jgi:hypothetical protein